MIYDPSACPPPCLLIEASQGLGKTSATLEAIAGIKDSVTVVMLVPTLEKADEAKRDYNKIAGNGSMPAYVFRGRGADDPEAAKEKMCPRCVVASRIAKVGLSVAHTLCQECPLHKTCGYQRQLREIKHAGKRKLIIAAQEMLFAEAFSVPVDLLIVDESVVLKAATECDFTIDRIAACIAGKIYRKMPGVDKVRDTLKIIQDLFLDEENAGSYLSRIRQTGIQRDDLVAAREFLEKYNITITTRIRGSMRDEEILLEVLKLRKSEAANIIAMLRQIEIEWDTGRSDFTSIMVNHNVIIQHQDGKEERQQRVYVHFLQRPVLAEGIPLLLLDGTASVTLNRVLFGTALQHQQYRVERDAEVMQIDHPRRKFSRQSLTGCDANGNPLNNTMLANARKLQAKLADFIKILSHVPILVTSNSQMVEALKPQLPKETRLGYFGALRGLNSFEDCMTCVCIGRQLTSVEDIEKSARAYAAANPEPFFSMSGEKHPYIPATRGMRMKDGTVKPIEVDIHPHPIVQEVLEQIREADIVQAVDRVRPIHNRRWIYLFNKLVTDITVDRVVPWAEASPQPCRLEQAARMGRAVPYSATEMARCCPGLWSTEKAAEHDLQRTPKDYIESLFRSWGFIAVEYKRESGRGKCFKAWVNKENPRESLESVVGIVAKFRIPCQA